MFSLLQRYREQIIVGLLLVVPLASYLTTGHRGRAPNLIDRGVLSIASPVQSGLMWTFEHVGDLGSGYVALRGAHEEAALCRTTLSEAHDELNSLKEAQAENTRLKSLLNYVEASVDQEVVARVIGVNPSAQFQSIRINRGDDDGVRVGMPVVTPDGVVGQVVRAVGGSADVMLVTDVASRIGGVIQRSRVRATVSGTGDGHRLSVDFVRREDDVRDGDVVVTAGSDGIFPRGVVVGTVKTPERPSVGLWLKATLVPSVEFNRIEEVAVIPVSMELPAAAATKERP
jgi:rod shape-determining protein MreC